MEFDLNNKRKEEGFLRMVKWILEIFQLIVASLREYEEEIILQNALWIKFISWC